MDRFLLLYGAAAGGAGVVVGGLGDPDTVAVEGTAAFPPQDAL